MTERQRIEEIFEGDFWFSLRNQKYFAFQIAKELLISGAEPDESIEIAMEFVNQYYDKAVKKGAWQI